MYIESFRVTNLKCFADLEIKFSKRAEDDPDSQSNWNVILGNNGYGKSTLLQAIAVCLMDATTADRAAKPNSWIRQVGGQVVEKAELELCLYQEVRSGKKFDILKGPTTETSRLVPYQVVRMGPDIAKIVVAESNGDVDILMNSAFSREQRKGWISCGYGPFRRVYGFSNETATIKDMLQKRFITLFNEGASIYDCENWLKDLERRAIKSRQGSNQRRDFEDAKRVICELLPGVGKVDIETYDETTGEDKVTFWYGDDETDVERRRERFNLDELSDGYRSMFALAIDMLNWFLLLRPTTLSSAIPLNEVSGVVLIDEVDAHLHPEWQKKIGYLLTRAFPNIQFIVATHSPYVAMAAGKEALVKLVKQGDAVIASPQVYVRGWPVDQVLREIFNVSIRDRDTEEKLKRYDELTGYARQRELTQEELTEYNTLESELKQRLVEAKDFREQQRIYKETAALIEMAHARNQRQM